jgi:apolipoprotein N-acyltransferase
VSVFFSCLRTQTLWLSESVDFLSLLDIYLPVFLVLLAFVCVCLCHGVHRQTNRHSRGISEVVPAHTRSRTHAEITRAPLGCGGDEC